jgi:hypothetical protein
VETFRPAETKPPVSMKSFHGMQSFHVIAAGGTAALPRAAPRRPCQPGVRGGRGPRGRRSVNGIAISRIITVFVLARRVLENEIPQCGSTGGRISNR